MINIQIQTFQSQKKITNRQNTILPQAIHYWESALMVRPLNVPIRLSRYAVSAELSPSALHLFISLSLDTFTNWKEA